MGLLLRNSYNFYFEYWGRIDDPLDFHAFMWIYDFPVLIFVDDVLRPYGIGYLKDNLWNYAVMDTILLAVGTLYWFLVGVLHGKDFQHAHPTPHIWRCVG